MIETLGNHNHRVVVWICDRMMFWFKFYMDLSVFLCLEMFRQTLGTNLGIRDSKLGFWGENEVLPER